MDLTKSFLPDTVIVSGKHYKIHTGHSYWFRFAQILGQDVKLLSEFTHFYKDEIPEDQQSGVEALYNFFYEKKEIPRSFGEESSDRVLDYEIDSDLIYSAILQCYGIDLFDKQYHWHKVRAMLAGLSGTRLNDIMGYRCADVGKSKELARIKSIWALPEKMSAEEKEALDRFNAQFI